MKQNFIARTATCGNRRGEERLMIARKSGLIGIVLSLLLPGCVVEQRDFEALRDQVRTQQKQINDLKTRQEEQGLRVDTLNNGFKILGDKAEESARRIDELEERGERAPVAGVQPAAPPPPAPLVPPQATAPAQVPAVLAPAPVAPPVEAAAIRPPEAAIPPSAPRAGAAEQPPAGEVITAGPKADKLYTAALALFSNRDYQQAAVKFQEFVSLYPDHKLAGNAQYWIGECSYSRRRFE
jgi:TolA-binding protein